MKVCAFIVSFIIVTLTHYKSVECAKKLGLPELTEMITPLSKSCKGKSGTSQELIEGTRNGEFPRDPALMCYFRCLSTMLKVMNKEGKITLKLVEAQIDKLVKEDLAVRLKDVGRQCYETVPKIDDACEYAYDLVICGYNKDKSLYFLP